MCTMTTTRVLILAGMANALAGVGEQLADVSGFPYQLGFQDRDPAGWRIPLDMRSGTEEAGGGSDASARHSVTRFPGASDRRDPHVAPGIGLSRPDAQRAARLCVFARGRGRRHGGRAAATES